MNFNASRARRSGHVTRSSRARDTRTGGDFINNDEEKVEFYKQKARCPRRSVPPPPPPAPASRAREKAARSGHLREAAVISTLSSRPYLSRRIRVNPLGLELMIFLRRCQLWR